MRSAFWLAALLALSGCLSSNATDRAPVVDEDDPSTGNATTLAPLPAMVQSGCTSYYSMHSAPFAWAATYMPEGFTALPRDGSGVYFASKSWQCQETTIGNATVPFEGLVLYYIGVTPPEELRHPDSVFYWLPLEMIGHGPVIEHLGSLGFPASSFQSSAFERMFYNDLDVWRASADSSAGTSAAVEVEILQKDAAGEFLVRYFAVTDLEVVGWLDITVHPQVAGSGTARLDLSGEHTPSDALMTGDGSFQGWGPDDPSYTWLATRLPAMAG